MAAISSTAPAVGRTDFIRFILLTLLSLFSADKMEDMSKMLDPLEDKLRVKKFLTIISRVSEKLLGVTILIFR